MVLIVITAWLKELRYYIKALRTSKDGLVFILDNEKVGLVKQDCECCIKWTDIAGWHVVIEELQHKHIREVFEYGKNT